MASETATRADADSQALMNAAQAMLPRIAELSAEANARADVLPETIAAMKHAKLLRAYQPSRWGGLELDPRDTCDIQNVFAQGCAQCCRIISRRKREIERRNPICNWQISYASAGKASCSA